MGRHSYDLGIGLSPDHAALADSVQAFATKIIDHDHVRAVVEQPREDKFPFYWDALVGQGLLGLHVPEDKGGDGAGVLTAAVALEALARTIAPGPYVPTVLASAALSAADAAPFPISDLIGGRAVGAVAMTAPLPAREVADGWQISGVCDGVLGAEHADVLIVPIDTGTDDAAWAAITPDQVTITAQDSIDVLRGAARVELVDAVIGADAVLSGLSRRRLRSIATVILGAEAVGIISWCVGTAADYATTRVQFGRPIGQFQGVKHKCARMGIALEKARAVLWDAAGALDRDDETADYAAAIAAAIVPDIAVQVAQDCIQVHGGIGFTWEHDAHLYYRRALSIRAQFPSREERLTTVADHAVAGDLLPTDLELPAEADAIRTEIRAALEPIADLGEDDQLIALGDGGWVQPHLPTPYGRSASPLEQVIIADELAAAKIQLPQLLMGGWAVQAVVAHGTDEQKRDLAVPTLRGDLVWCQLFSEPGAGSDLASITTKAERVDGGWRVNGQKIWTTVAQFADWAMLIARTDPTVPKHDGITYFVLDMSTPGITVRPLREMTGSALFNEVFLDDVFVPDSAVVGEVNDGWNVARTTLAGERVALSQKMEAYATDRDLLTFVTGRDLSPLATATVGELIAESRAIDVIGARVVLKQLSGSDVSTTSSVGKLLGMGLGQSISEFIVAELGVAGAVSVAGQPSDKAMDQLISGRATTIYGGTTEVQLNVIGERMLGLPRDAA
ncbi:acyl-CoA dehydrogenase [Gordonia soli]|uniref:Putative acyl-CoA dehydrogenase n=1 Tax=Gordonia soli NBRC 108243 TaxID=1223545 RepID=M0QI65_9ACTN|nr:acyl-CoA dehydrogenase [Gordonia soli]GAC68238.1 putative acyl-CoA dehydrogenase [Gordonia soli NBRC 108243]